MARRPTLDFLRTESGAGALLAVAAGLAAIAANSPLSTDYFAFVHAVIPVRIGDFHQDLSVADWIKDGLMAVFFLVVGMEIKFEVLRGELSSPRRLAFPLLAAAGGMIVPALIYLAVNLRTGGTPGGWPIPTATDIAFALAGLALVARRLPPSLRVFLLTLAIADDLGAVAIIAAVFTRAPHWLSLGGAGAVLAGLILLSRWRRAPFAFYGAGFLLLWFFTLQAGVSTSLAGVLAAFTVPIGSRRAGQDSTLKTFMDGLHPYVAYAVLPLFAFTAAGFSLHGMTWARVASPMTLGIVAGLVVGKPLGVFGFAAAAAGARLGRRPSGATWLQLLGVAMMCGAGFTMSLFLGALAFPASDALVAAQIRLAVVLGSVLSVLAGASLLSLAPPSATAEGDE
jgi:NhaA family Na+:H+ antiporter